MMTGGSPAYGVSKAGLNALTRVLAAELARDGILVNAVCPGWPASESHPEGRSLTQAAASVIWAVTIPNGGPTGTPLTRDGQPFPWWPSPRRGASPRYPDAGSGSGLSCSGLGW